MSSEYENIKSTWSEKFVERNIKSTWIEKFVEGNIKGNTFVDYNNLNNMQMDSRVHDWSITPQCYTGVKFLHEVKTLDSDTILRVLLGKRHSIDHQVLYVRRVKCSKDSSI